MPTIRYALDQVSNFFLIPFAGKASSNHHVLVQITNAVPDNLRLKDACCTHIPPMYIQKHSMLSCSRLKHIFKDTDLLAFAKTFTKHRR